MSPHFNLTSFAKPPRTHSSTGPPDLPFHDRHFFGAAGQPFFASSQWQRIFENSPELSVLRAEVVGGHSSTFVITFNCSNGEPSDSFSRNIIVVLDVPSFTTTNVFMLPCFASSSTPALHASAGSAKCVSIPANLYVTLPSIHLSPPAPIAAKAVAITRPNAMPCPMILMRYRYHEQ